MNLLFHDKNPLNLNLYSMKLFFTQELFFVANLILNHTRASSAYKDTTLVTLYNKNLKNF